MAVFAYDQPVVQDCPNPPWRAATCGCDKHGMVLQARALSPAGQHPETGLRQYLATMWKDGRPADTGCGKKGLWETQADLIRQGFPLNIGDGFLDIDCGVSALMVEPIY